jgi:NTP pyrophosphatase (non-canonical NTP hydrolase)
MTHEEIVAVAHVLSTSAGMDSGVAYGLIADTIEALKAKTKVRAPTTPVVYYEKLEDANIAREAEWDSEGKLDMSFLGNAAAGEMGEVCNIIKKLERERLGLAGSRSTIAALAKELADVAIYTSLIAIKARINLDRAVMEKFNETSHKLGFVTRLHRCP